MRIAPLMSAALSLALAAPAFAAGPTRDEAVAMVHRVQDYYAAHGVEETAKAVMDPANEMFHEHGGALYAFMVDFDGVSVAHGANPKLEGKNTKNLKDPHGVFLVQEMIDIAKGPGEGWVDYHWPSKASGKIEAKTTFVMKLDDNLFAAAGVSAE